MAKKQDWDQLIGTSAKPTVPLAFYPSRHLVSATMQQILSDSGTGADCLVAMQETYEPSLLVRMTELWLEAEAFGAEIEIVED